MRFFVKIKKKSWFHSAKYLQFFIFESIVGIPKGFRDSNNLITNTVFATFRTHIRIACALSSNCPDTSKGKEKLLIYIHKWFTLAWNDLPTYFCLERMENYIYFAEWNQNLFRIIRLFVPKPCFSSYKGSQHISALRYQIFETASHLGTEVGIGSVNLHPKNGHPALKIYVGLTKNLNLT